MASASDTYGGSCAATHPEGCVDRRPGRYLVAVYWLEPGSGPRVRTGELGDRLGVHPSSVTEMLARLAADSLVDYEKHRGVELTGRGETVARELAWRQCTVRTFFASRLDLDLDANTAYRIGYALPKPGITRLAELVDRRGDGACPGAPPGEDACLFGAGTC